MYHRIPNASDFIRMRSFPFYTSLRLSPDGEYLQSGELFSGLRRLKKTGTLVWYRGGTHQTDTWKTEQLVDSWERIISWFEKYLK